MTTTGYMDKHLNMQYVSYLKENYDNPLWYNSCQIDFLTLKTTDNIHNYIAPYKSAVCY